MLNSKLLTNPSTDIIPRWAPFDEHFTLSSRKWC